jgi:hypothetical protein
LPPAARDTRPHQQETQSERGASQRLGNSLKWGKLRGWNDLNNVEFQPFTKTNSEGMEVMFSPGALKVALDGVR